MRREIETLGEKGEKKIKEKEKVMLSQQAKPMEPNLEIDTKEDIPIDGDYINGSRVFMRSCAGCHTLDHSNEGRQSVTGPPLGMIYARKIGYDKYFDYSKSYTDSEKSWSESNLFHYLRDPMRFFPDTKCIVPSGGVRDEGDRADLVKFLKLYTKNLKVNLDLRNRKTYGTDYVDTFNKAQQSIKEQQYKRSFEKP